MAKKSGKKAAKASAKSQAGQQTTSDRVIDAALALASEKDWRDISLAEIAEAAGLPLSEVYPVFRSKAQVLAGFSRRLDGEVLVGQDAEAREGGARDRLFDVIMRRLDAMEPHREALKSILAGLARDPGMALCGMGHLARSLTCMLEAADLSSDGLRGAVRVKALGAIYLATLRVWLGDESQDKAATMAVLDRHLRRAEWLATRCSRMRRIGAGNPLGTAAAAG
jgi:AcrR family transcriptional regulator